MGRIRCAWLAMFTMTVIAVVGGAPAAAAAVWYVANNGVDEVGCGGLADPCRSISRAIAHASAGDRIIVGPGRYGDLDEDGAFEPALGEEEPDFPGCNCMVKIDKRLTVESSAGAGATILDAGPSAIIAVRIFADGVIFGRSGRGFTVVGGGLRVDPGTTDVRVEDNTLDGKSAVVDGTGHTIVGNTIANGVSAHLDVRGDGHDVTGNIVRNGAGAVVFGGGHAITRNAFIHNLGFALTVNSSGSPISVQANVIVGNGHGVGLSGIGVVVFERNAIIGSRGLGMWVQNQDAAVHRNNIYGNDAINLNCGSFLNDTGGPLDASNNFWGAAGGPGPDPADAVCNIGGSTTTVDPVATRPFVINVPAAH